jgi:hypothetical protein
MPDQVEEKFITLIGQECSPIMNRIPIRSRDGGVAVGGPYLLYVFSISVRIFQVWFENGYGWE